MITSIVITIIASLFTQCHEEQARNEAGNIVGRWEWIRSESSFPPGTTLTPQTEGQTETYIFEADSTFQKLINGQTEVTGKFQLIDHGVDAHGLHFYELVFDAQEDIYGGRTIFRWVDASTLLMDYSPLDGPRRYFSRIPPQNTEK